MNNVEYGSVGNVLKNLDQLRNEVNKISEECQDKVANINNLSDSIVNEVGFIVGTYHDKNKCLNENLIASNRGAMAMSDIIRKFADSFENLLDALDKIEAIKIKMVEEKS